MEVLLVQDAPARSRSSRLARAVPAALGAVGLVAGLALDATRTLSAYLAAFLFAASTVGGGIVLLMIFHASDARWPIVVRRLVEAVAGVVPLLALLFLPLAVFAHDLYPWANPALSEEPLAKKLAHLGAWYSTGAFALRGLLYVVLWSGLVFALRRWSRAQDRSGDEALVRKARRLSGVGLLAFGFTFTGAAFDWAMSLTPAWRSSVYGAYVWAGGTVGFLGLLVLLMLAAGRRAPLREALGRGHWLSTGKLLLAFVVFWAYLFFSQYFIVWIAHLPEEVTWWVPRTTGWKWVTLALVVGHFALPFLALLSRGLKRRPRALAAVGAWLLAFHYLDAWWLVLPAHRAQPAPHWTDLAALLLVVGACVPWGLAVAGRAPLVPEGEPRLAASLAYEGS